MGPVTWTRNCHQLFNARDHLQIHRALVGSRGDAVVHASIRKILSDLVRTDLAASIHKKSEDAAPRELVVQYVVGGYMAVLTSWLDGGRSYPRIEQCFGAWRPKAS